MAKKKEKKLKTIKKGWHHLITKKVALVAVASKLLLVLALFGGYKFALNKFNPDIAYNNFVSIATKAVFLGCMAGQEQSHAVGTDASAAALMCKQFAVEARGQIGQQISVADLFRDYSKSTDDNKLNIRW